MVDPMRASAAVLGILLAACHSAPSSPVPLVGAPDDLARLAGEWDGTYEADDGSRGGSIDFHLKAGRDTALGDVLMVPTDWGRPLEAWERPAAAVADGTAPRTLMIRFVRVVGGEVSGQLEPYRDPTCGCRLLTTFRGRLVGDRIEGQYQTYHQEAARTVTGRWRVHRTGAGP
jgi:hypothetical protein